MKKTLSIALFLTLGLSGMAQETNKPQPASSDTVIYAKGRKFVINEADKKLNVKVYGKTAKGDTISDDMVYEATYNDEQTTERRFEYSVILGKKKKTGFISHNSQVYMGLATLSNTILPGSNHTIGTQLSRSYEYGIVIFGISKGLSKDGHWGFNTGLDCSFSIYKLKKYQTLSDNNGTTTVVEGPDNNRYGRTTFSYGTFRIPLNIEWQTMVDEDTDDCLHASIGLEPELKYTVRSRAVQNGDDIITGRGLHTNNVGLNLLIQAGMGSIGFYMRSSLVPLFKSDHGPKVFPCSFGFAIYM